MRIKTNSPHAWFLAARPKTLGAAFCPILIGGAFAIRADQFNAGIFLATLLCSMLLQVMANLINDYGDFLKGSDTKERLGPARAMQNGWLSEDVMRLGIVIVLMFSSLLGLMLVYQGGVWVFIIGLLSIFFCFWYSLGPKPLSRLGFSEIFIWIFFGPLAVMGSYFLQTLTLSKEVFIASLGPGFLAVALLMTNNLRDINEDRRHHKMTLAVRFGEKTSRILIRFFIIMAFAIPLPMLYFAYKFHWSLFFAYIAFALLLSKLRILDREPPSKSYNLVLEAIGKSLYLYGILLSFGVVLS